MTTTPIPTRIGIRVYGTPIPQGSKVANRHAPGVRDSNAKKLKPWRATITATAIDAIRYHDGLPITEPVQIWLRFAFPRPASHYRTGRNGHLLRDTAPLYPTHKNDLDKLQRAVLDALTDARVWVDDGLVVDVRARKFYAGEHELAPDQPGVDIILEQVTP